VRRTSSESSCARDQPWAGSVAEALWRFVFEPGVDPTNNHAERELRGLVCWRRSTGGSRSDRGDLFAANLKSVIHTCRKQRRHVLTYLNSAIHAALHDRKTPSLIAAR